MITMTGHDRVFEVPRYVREWAGKIGVNHPLIATLTSGRVTAWDLLDPDLTRLVPQAEVWSRRVLDSVTAAAYSRREEVLACEECADTGFYGITDIWDDDILRSLVRRSGSGYEQLQASGDWQAWDPKAEALEVLDYEIAQDLADAVLAGASGLARRYFWPQAFIPPETLLAASPVDMADATEAQPVGSPGGDAEGWFTYAVVDELDTGAVLQLIRLRQGPELEKFEGGTWIADAKLLAQLVGVKPPPLVELTPDQIDSVKNQIASGSPDAPPEGDKPAADQPEAPQSDQEPVAVADDSVAAAGALVADAPLTVSPNPKAEKLRRYWSTGGKGGLKIRWGTPGDWKRCFRQLSKHMGERAKGYCANLHKRNTGMWTGSKLNASAFVLADVEIAAATGGLLWTPRDTMSTSNGTVASGHLPEGEEMVAALKDGIYRERDTLTVIRTLTAGAFPTAPPDEWFENPNFTKLAGLTVEDDGRVHGHLADFNMSHIGLPGSIRPPKSRSNYAYYQTGKLRTASGKIVRVGQLTLTGGHAPLDASAAQAVKHYDDTNSAVADVHVGEDRHGIWFAGALRPDVTPSQVRAFMASALSGDWRPINGNLEMVACCSVNVPGFPIAEALAAGGAIISLVAAGARGPALVQASVRADAAVLERLETLEEMWANSLVEEPEEAVVDDDEEPTAEAEATEEEVPELDQATLDANDEAAARLARARQLVADRRAAAVVDTAPDGTPVPIARLDIEPPVAPVAEVAATPSPEAAARRAELRARVHRKAADADPKAEAASGGIPTRPALTAASIFREWEHLRGTNGEFIEMGGKVNIIGRNGKKDRRGVVTRLTEKGPEITYSDDKSKEIIPLADVVDIVTPAPKSVAKLDAPSVGVERDAEGKLVVSDEAKRLGSGVYQRAVEAEPGITDTVSSLAGDADPENYTTPITGGGGKLYGYKYRLKAEAGLQEKVERIVEEKDLTREKAAEDIKDSVRYTIHYDSSEFNRQAAEMIGQLRDANANVLVKNTWGPNPPPYQGINLAVTTKSGLVYEVQFHTPESQAAKDQMHALYEDQRVLARSDPTWARLDQEMWAINRSTAAPPAPPAITEIK